MQNGLGLSNITLEEAHIGYLRNLNKCLTSQFNNLAYIK